MATAAMLAGLLPHLGFAGEVALKSSDGTVNLVGELIEFKDDSYVIRTALGELRVAASRVRCEGDSCPTFETAAANVRITGSDTLGEGVMPLLMSGYAGYLDAEASITNTNVAGQVLASLVADAGFGDDIGSFLISSTNSGNGFEALLNKEAAIAMSSRRITPAEARALKGAGMGNMVAPTQEYIVAVDGLVVIVNPENEVETLNVQDLARIFSGEYTNWSQLGGVDLPITVVSPPEGSDSSAVLDAQIFGASPRPRPDSAIIVEDNTAVAAAVNQEPGAIGFVGFAFERGAKPVTLVNECNITVEPDSFSAKTEEYALQRRLYLYTTEAADQMTRDFLTFAQSESADGVIAKAGFVDLGVERRAQTIDGGRAVSLLNSQVDAFEGNVIREFLAQMIQFDRLSTTFRFRLGSANLDERARLDMERLTKYLERMPEGTRVTLVGFTDDVGAFVSNQKLSQERARAVADELVGYAGTRLAGIDLTSQGYGEIAPAACNSTEAGRGINRRVEVWIDKTAAD
ncbi:phosphate ABC transporter substrate-binding/OmpA family protein [Defluviimonas sp. WL0075]|uniref:Phosphate ABC transporter substrate-binding/OmpA family protein n=1 Tax=Albidovulum sediminicola TaxID=2984331 RepID=A0ABT2YY29_9RHOB|nr:phosphate ABC transporter substrate-binding/OmpA family protein [Defluviimonas sp. WL0075]MCV2863751.1 phosphate ABC transporter substrate-binding/OmpA family protein [Defluviimonas sp. WL0075]